jgi:hypothetical protein
MAVGEQPFHLSRCPNFRNQLKGYNSIGYSIDQASAAEGSAAVQ